MNTTQQDKQQGRISILSRVVAGLLAIAFLLAAPDIWHRATATNDIAETLFLLISLVACCLLFGFVSISGREPKLLARLTVSIDRELTRDVLRERSTWIGSQAAAIIVFGAATAIAFYFLAKDYVFENEGQTAWVVYFLFLLGWLVLIAMFLAYSKHRFEKLKNEGFGQVDGEN